MRIFMTKGFARFVRHENLGGESLLEAVTRADAGLIDADLGGGLIKQRIARAGQGRSAGYRTVLAYRRSGRAVFLFGFSKKDLGNIDQAQLHELRVLGANWLNTSQQEIERAISSGFLEEVRR